MKLKMSTADKSFYVAEYLSDLFDNGSLLSRTVCENSKHSIPGQIGFEVDGETALAWAREVSAALHRPTRRK